MNTTSNSIDDARIKALGEFYAANDDALFNQTTIAHVLDCSKAKLERDRWLGGGIRFIKFGRSVRYSKCDVLSWLGQHQSQASTSETLGTSLWTD